MKAKLERIFKGRVSDSFLDRIAYSRDQTPLGLIKEKHGSLNPLPDFVVWAKTTEEISELLKLAQREGFPIIPFGAGSGVCGGTWALKGGIVVDLKLMDRIEVDHKSGVVMCEPGIIGEILERKLNEEGYTLGHFPASMWCSSVGGWISTRSAGQLSSKYGKIEDMVIGLEVVLPTGEIVKVKPKPRGAEGPELLHLFVGAEGTLGIITKAWLRIWRKPEKVVGKGFEFKSFSDGIETVREIAQSGIRPSVVRLYDELETFLLSSRKIKLQDPLISTVIKMPDVSKFVKGGALLVIICDGKLAREEIFIVEKIVKKYDAKNLGEEPVERWLKERYKVSFRQSAVFISGGFADTMEVASLWKDVKNVVENVKKSVDALITAHISHIYPEGCGIYFTFVARCDEYIYKMLWKRLLSSAQDAGASLSHHHGIGFLKSEFMPKEHGLIFEVMKGIKKLLDPSGVLNPRKIIAPPSTL